MSSIKDYDEESPQPLPIDTIFKLPFSLPKWPQGSGFGTGVIDLGGLQIQQITSFNKIWAANYGGPDNLGATFFEPASIPDGFSMLGHYAQSNNRPLSGWVIVAKTDASDALGEILKPPTDYTLQSTADTNAYFWTPTAPDGYKPVGLFVTTTPEKPPLDKIRCVRADFTDELETDVGIWSGGDNGPTAYWLRPKTRGSKAPALSAGTFVVLNGTQDPNAAMPISSLKNKSPTFWSMPNLDQIQALFSTYAPYIYFHPDENYLPSSVNWFFTNGALLYTKGNESSPVPIALPDGPNLPPGGPNDGSYWLDLPADKQAREKIVRGDLQTAEVYLHVKNVLGASFTDVQVWVFYPFNGRATARLGPIKRISLGQIGEHVGDWEHVTLRISNFDGALSRVFFAQHGGGEWVDSSLLEFPNGNKFAVYPSLNGHASYHRAGLTLLGNCDDVGIRDDAARGEASMDTGARFVVVAAEEVAAPPWLEYSREWGPKVSYDIAEELKKVEKVLIGSLKSKFKKFVSSLPQEVLGEEGPTGPKMKSNWEGDES
ncbi:Plant protein of unknown function (DUF946 [Striga hermonthica]|uniref:Vacuolar protein sorting-associated protein 62 n=1 Tax=Striga hermonthica TaxID=68872 RepID=A0A9N7MQS5_STRHE|nr:Plant protein of unknown function (DUF946 [Striga hermonthica]